MTSTNNVVSPSPESFSQSLGDSQISKNDVFLEAYNDPNPTADVSRPIRKRKGTTLTLKEENDEQRLAAKRERRCKVVCRLAMEMEDESEDGSEDDK